MTDFETQWGRLENPVTFLLLGIGVTAGVGLLTAKVTDPLAAWTYNELYAPLGPHSAARLTGLGSYTTSTVVALGALTGLVALLSEQLLRRSIAGQSLLVQLLILGLAPVSVLVHPSLAVLLCLFSAVLLGVVVRAWFRSDERSAGTAALAGGILVFVPVVLVAMLLPVIWPAYSVSATEVSSEWTDQNDAVDSPAVTAIFNDSRMSCNENQTSVRTCSILPADRVIRFLDRHRVRCPYWDLTNRSSVVVRHNGTAYRMTCTRLD